MKRVIGFFLTLCFVGPVMAQDDISISTGIVGNGRYLGGKTADGQGTVPMLGVDASSNTVMNCLSGKECRIAVDKTPVAKVSSTGLTFASAGQQIRNETQPPVITPMVNITPVSAAVLSARLSIMATAAPTLAIVQLPAATSNPNSSYAIYNKGASPLLISPNGAAAGTDAINAAAAATPFSCATTKLCECRTIGTANYVCVAM